MRCSLSASPEATSRHGIGESIGAYGTPSKRTWFRQAPLRKRTNRFRRMAKRWSKWTPPRVKKYKLPVKRNILTSKAFCLLEGVVTPLSLSKRLLGAKEWLVFEPFAEWKNSARTSKRIFSPKACYTHTFPEISSLEIRSRFCYPDNMHLLNHRPVLKNGSSWKLGHFFPYGYFNDGSSRFFDRRKRTELFVTDGAGDVPSRPAFALRTNLCWSLHMSSSNSVTGFASCPIFKPIPV